MRKSKGNIFEILIALYYTWFFMPIVNAYFSDAIFKYMFFAMFAVGMGGLLFLKGRFLAVPLNRMTVAVLVYFATMTFLYIINAGDASSHIRVSFTFWGTLLLYFFALDDYGKIRLGKYFILLLIITCITSSVGVAVDNNAARTIAHADADDELQHMYSMKNIASIYLFQCMVMLIPTIVGLSKSRRAKIICGALIVTLLFVLVNASFTISLILFFATLFLTLMLTKSNRRTALFLKILICIMLASIVFFAKDVLEWFANVVNNGKINERITEIVDYIYGTKSASGDLAMRKSLYLESWYTFCDNPIFGVGPHYSYIRFENGLGYHSQLLDDMARYGVAAVIFYVMFFTGYYRMLKAEWQEKTNTKVALITTFVYVIFLIFNLGFRSGVESVVMLFVVPVIPKLYSARKIKRGVA